MGKPVLKQPRQSYGAESATKREPLTLDGATGSPVPTPPRKRGKHIKLSSVSDVAEELARLYRQARAGEVETSDASRLAYMLNMLGGLLESVRLEARIQQLEQLIEDED